MTRLAENAWLSSRPWLDLEQADVREYVRRVGEESDFDLENALEKWRNEGIVLFEGVVDPALIDALEADVDYLRRHHRDFDLLIEVQGHQKHVRDLADDELGLPGVKFNSIHTISRAASRLSLTRQAVVFLRHVFGDAPCVLQSLTFYKGSQQSIHIDYPYVRCQSELAHLAATWIPLEDISPDSGPLAYYPGSHRTDVSGFFDWGDGSIVLEPDSVRTPAELSEYLAMRVAQAGIKPRIYCPRKGDLLVWHGNLSHEGSAIFDQSATRKSYVSHYTSLAAYPKAHLKPRATESGYIFKENGAYVFEYSWQHDLRQLPSIGTTA